MGFFSSLLDAVGAIPLDDHLQFQGISLGEKIESFHDQLLMKGWKYDREMNEELQLGGRCYEGTFAGGETDLVVKYNIITRKIQFVMPTYQRTDYRTAECQYKQHILNIESTYRNVFRKVKVYYDSRDYVALDRYELQHGSIICGIIQDGYKFAAFLEYVNTPDNDEFYSR